MFLRRMHWYMPLPAKACFGGLLKILVILLAGAIFFAFVTILTAAGALSLGGPTDFLSPILVILLVGSCLVSLLFFYLGFNRYKGLPQISALAKAHIQMEILPFDRQKTLLRCTWLTPTSVSLTHVSMDAIQRSSSSLNADLSSLKKEAEFLHALNGIIKTKLTAADSVIDTQLFPCSDASKGLLTMLMKDSIELTDAYRRYHTHHYPSLRETAPIASPNQMHSIFEALQNNLVSLKTARNHLEQQSSKAGEYLDALREKSSFLDNTTEQLLNSYQNVCQDSKSQETLVKNLMFAT